MDSPRQRVLFVGTPGADEVSDWAALRGWAAGQGWESTRTLAAGEVECVVATADVLGGYGSPAEEHVLRQARAAGLRCLSVHAAVGAMAGADAPAPAGTA